VLAELAGRLEQGFLLPQTVKFCLQNASNSAENEGKLGQKPPLFDPGIGRFY